MRKITAFISMLLIVAAGTLTGNAQQVGPTTSDSVATVYFIKDITPENLIRIYDALIVGQRERYA